MTITYNPQSNTFVARADFEEKDALKEVGFKWDPERKKWWTGHSKEAAELYQHCDLSARKVILSRVSPKRAEQLKLSSPDPLEFDWSAAIDETEFDPFAKELQG